tara:strand:- start:20768 stop:21031 length:264 start_codon:yes stop_codon:yes gene_type:complete
MILIDLIFPLVLGVSLVVLGSVGTGFILDTLKTGEYKRDDMSLAPPPPSPSGRMLLEAGAGFEKGQFSLTVEERNLFKILALRDMSR